VLVAAKKAICSSTSCGMMSRGDIVMVVEQVEGHAPVSYVVAGARCRINHSNSGSRIWISHFLLHTFTAMAQYCSIFIVSSVYSSQNSYTSANQINH